MEIDVAFSAWAKHAETMEQGQKNILSAVQPVPLWKNFGYSNVPVAAANTTQTITLGGPAAGRVWYVHRVAILGADGHTAVAGMIVDVYGGPGEVADAPAQMYAGLAVPTIIVEGRFHNPLQYGDRLYAIGYNVPSNQTWSFSAGVEDYPAPSVMAMKIK